MDEALPVNDAYICAPKAYASTQNTVYVPTCVSTARNTPIDRNFLSYLSYLHEPINTSYQPPTPLSLAYLSSCASAPPPILVPEIWAIPKGRNRLPAVAVDFLLGTSAANRCFWSGARPPAAASNVEACGINHTEEKGQPIFIERQSCSTRDKHL